jgi:diphthine-ammonia ligase
MREKGFAVMWSGGKDSCLALARAVQDGLAVDRLVNFYDAGSDRVRFHAIRKEIIAAQAAALDCELTQVGTDAAGYSDAFRGALKSVREQGYRGVIFGNIHLRDVRAFCESASSEVGLEHVEPLWGEDPGRLVSDFVERGFKAVLTCCQLEKLDARWLGRELDARFIEDIHTLGGVDPCGENGEYHSCVTGGPLFRNPLPLRPGRSRISNGFAQLDMELSS